MYTSNPLTVYVPIPSCGPSRFIQKASNVYHDNRCPKMIHDRNIAGVLLNGRYLNSPYT